MKAAAYLLAESDYQGIVRADVQVLRGNPDQVAALADSLSFVHRYTSGVISWAPGDKPTPEKIEATLTEFEALAFAGLESDRYAWTAVLHQEANGAVHIHTLNARVDLATGKSLNIAPPGWQTDFDPLRDALNWHHGWARPDDPARARLLQPGHQALIDAAALRMRLQTPTDAKRQITDWLASRIKSGQVVDRSGVLHSLAEIGEITRAGKDYISVRPQGFDKPIRLKGAVYGEGFEVSAEPHRPEHGTGAEKTAGHGAGAGINCNRVADAREQLADAIRRRSDFNRRRYTDAGRRASRKSSLDIDPGAGVSAAAEPAVAAGVGGAGRSVENRTGKAKPAVAELNAEDREPESDAIKGNRTDATPVEVVAVDLLGQPDRLPAGLCRDLDILETGQPMGNHNGSGWHGMAGDEGHQLAEVPGQPALPTIWDTVRGIYDRARETVVRGVFAAIRRARGAIERARHHDQQLGAAGVGFITAGQQLDQATGRAHEAHRAVAECVQHISREVERGCRRMKQNFDDELERFKSEINLVEYAQAQGYEIDKRESSRASTVMHQGDDKIIVATDQDGHGIYFAVRDDADNGSVIDFVQKRQVLNLGQVRRELRGWCPGSSSYRPLSMPEAERPRKPEASNADRQRVLAVWMQMEALPNGGNPYLVEQRKLTAETLADPRFANHIRADTRGNAVFSHYDRAGLTGYELKNDGFTGFSKGGEKALWHSTNLAHADRVVIVESAIDALSHAQLFKGKDDAYISIGGAMSDKQKELLVGTLKKAHERGAQIVIATDADEPGRKLALDIANLAPKGASLDRQEPAQGVKDWNDQVKAETGRAAYRFRYPGMGGPS